MIPLVDLRRQYESIKPEVDEAVGRVLASGRFVMGGNVAKFEEEFARYCGRRHGIGVNSGSDALYLALRALGLRRNGVVLLPSFTFVSTADAVVRNGLVPRFVDVGDDCTVDPERLEAAHTPGVVAVVVVHLYGKPARMDEVLEYAERHGVPVVEDCAQAHGAWCGGRNVGSFGVASCFSFYPSKPLGAYGDGGMVLTDDAGLAERIRALREYGQVRKNEHEFVGVNSRLDELQAAVLRVKLSYLDGWNLKRRELARLYCSLLSELAGDKILLQYPETNPGHVYHLFVVRLLEPRLRERVTDRLNRSGIGWGIHYPRAVHEQPAYSLYAPGDARESLKNSEAAARGVLSLPMFAELTSAEVAAVAEAVGEALRDG